MGFLSSSLFHRFIVLSHFGDAGSIAIPGLNLCLQFRCLFCFRLPIIQFIFVPSLSALHELSLICLLLGSFVIWILCAYCLVLSHVYIIVRSKKVMYIYPPALECATVPHRVKGGVLLKICEPWRVYSEEKSVNIGGFRDVSLYVLTRMGSQLLRAGCGIC